MKSMLMLNYTVKLRNISWMFFSDFYFRDQSCSANTLEQVSKQFEISLTGWLCKDLWCYQWILLVEAPRNNFVVLGEVWYQITKASEIISCAEPDVQILKVQLDCHCLRPEHFSSDQECAFEAELPVLSICSALVRITELSRKKHAEFLSDDSRRQLCVLQLVMNTQYVGSY